MFKKIFFWLVYGLLPLTVSAENVLEVCPSCGIPTISEAIEKADSGDLVLVKKGVYKETDLHIRTPITLRAEEGVILDGQNKGEILLIEADNVTVEGFEIIHVGTSNLRDYAAIRIKKSTNFLVQNNVIKKPFFAIYLERSSNGLVQKNKIFGKATGEFNAGNGVQLWYSHSNKIVNNEIHQMRDGIYLEFSDDNLIQGNLSENSVRYGLHFMFCNENRVERNTFQRNGAGIAIMFSKKMKASRNIFKDNWGATAYGMLLKEVYDTELAHNLFQRNTTGIQVEGSNRILYEYNDFVSNGWAVNARGANYDMTFTKNNFLNNSFDLAYNGAMNGNSFNGNYWSDYKGYDLDKDGVGDVPYRPIKLFSYLIHRVPNAIILLRSLFIDIVDFSEKVSPVFTPDNLLDEFPSMKMFRRD